MTKREICERLMEIRDQSSAGHLGPVGIRDALRDLILDLVVPEEDWLQRLDDEPNLTYYFKYMLRRHIKTHGDMSTVCDNCQIAECCDSTVHEACLELQKEAAK